MSLNAKNAPGSGKRPDPIDAGSYPARLVQVISLGLQAQEFKGEKKDPRVDLYLTYELLDEFLKDEDGEDDLEKPRWISERMPLYNLDQDKAKSTARYYALDPQGVYEGDWTALVGAPCMVTVVQNEKKGKVYNNISATSAMRDKDAKKAPDLVNPTRVFDPEDPDMSVWKQLPEWLQEVVKENLDFDGSVLSERIEANVEENEDKEGWQ